MPNDREDSPAGRRVDPWSLVALGIGLLVFTARARVTDARYTFCDDIAEEALPLLQYTYNHPWDALLGIPSPSVLLGTDVHDPELARSLPFVPQLLGLLAPRDLVALVRFEWLVTSVCARAGVLGMFALLRRLRLQPALAAAFAALHPSALAISLEFYHLPPHRAKLLVPIALAAALRAWDTRRYRDALAAAAAWIVCLGLTLQAYWMIVMVAAAVLAAAVLRRRAILAAWRTNRRVLVKRAMPLVVGVAAVLAVLGPAYARLRHALADSEWERRLAGSADLQLRYLAVDDWLKPTAALLPVGSNVAPVGGLSPLALAGLALLASTTLLRAVPATRLEPIGDRLSTRVAGLVFVVAAPLFAFSQLPARWFGVDGPAVTLLGIRLPHAVTVLAHTPARTWLPMMEVSGAIAAATALSRWVSSTRTPLARTREILLAALVYVVALVLAGSAWGALDIGTVFAAVAALAASLALVATLSADRGAARRTLETVVVAGAVGFGLVKWAALVASMTFSPDGAEKLRRVHEALAASPPELKHRYDVRIASLGTLPNLPLLLDSAGGDISKPRFFRSDVADFFRAAGAFRDVLPYHAQIDYRRMYDLGLLPLLGIRYWISDEGSVPSFPRGAARPIGTSGFVLWETPDAFPKAWALRSWDLAPDRASAVARLEAIARAGDLRTRGVVMGTGPASEGGAEPGAAEVRVEDVRPGTIRTRTASASAFVVATSELFRPGWDATVDGAPAKVLVVDGGFVGVAAPAGEHDVRLRLRVP